MKKWLNIFLGVLLLIVNTEAFAAKKSKKPELKLAKLKAQQSYTYKFTRYTGLDGKMGGNLNIKPLTARGDNFLKGGKTFSQFKSSYWSGRVKPTLDPIINPKTSQVWKLYTELHNRLNLTPASSLRHTQRIPIELGSLRNGLKKCII